MKKHSSILILILLLINSSSIKAQEESVYKNRVHIGLGGEDGYLGVDYSRQVYPSKIFLGIGCGLGTGWTGYVRYEPYNWKGLSPFISSGISYSFGGTLIVVSGTSIFSASAGLNYLPKLKWRILPTFGIGTTYYAILTHNAEKEINDFGPLIKIGIAFPKK